MEPARDGSCHGRIVTAPPEANPMPPDVFLVLASSGLSLVASLLFLVSDEREPRVDDGPSVVVLRATAAAARARAPAPRTGDLLRRRLDGLAPLGLDAQAQGDEWTMTLDMAP
jgi:hypothetical protein